MSNGQLILGRIRAIHFVGIGGAGMSGIAEVLLNLGFKVSGSDLRTTSVTDRLQQLGAKIMVGHAPGHVHGAQVVVVSSAVPPENPEIVEAARLQIPVIPRAEMLGELMRLKFCVAVAGAHGKTTTTSMVAVMLAEAGLDPTAVIGGRLDAFGSGARLGKGDVMVVEADESDRSFLYLLPSLAVVTNIDREHLDHYRDLEEIETAFVSFVNKVPFYGAVIACADEPWRASLESILSRIRRRVVTYGVEGQADVTVKRLDLGSTQSELEVVVKGKPMGRVVVHVAGRHNAQNALAAVAVGLELDLTAGQICRGLERFHGADRRFQILAEVDGITVVDDYGHHPTEIRATLEAARLRAPRRLWVVFQPHRYTRTKLLMDELATCFDGCDGVEILDIYPASETAIPGITSERLVERMKELGFDRARYAPSESTLVQELLDRVLPGDLLMTIGAGNVWKIGDAIAKGLKARAARAEPAQP